MFVVEVWTLVLPSALRMSAGRPDDASVIAAIDAHVRAAYSRSWPSPADPGPDAALAVGALTVTSSAASAAALPTQDRMAAQYPSARKPDPRAVRPPTPGFRRQVVHAAPGRRVACGFRNASDERTARH